MRILVQRVRHASVAVSGSTIASIGRGLLVLVGVAVDDSEEDAAYLAGKAARLRIFDDEQGVMNRDIMQIDGQLLAVSQFTLLASTRKGNRPSYIGAAAGTQAQTLYERFAELLEHEAARPVARGRFGADMQVTLCNDGPVTIWIDSKNRE